MTRSKNYSTFSVKPFRKKLLSWYFANRRDLPWRKTKDPYRIWLSEIMLQQTRVDTVIPYYENFLIKFPTVTALSNAEDQDVLKMWEGLGYYSRARNLLSAAREVTETYGGKLPQNSTELSQLKGFGPYTCAAVASIAFDEPIAVVDGNVKRVVSRLFASNENISEHAQEVLEPSDPSSFNQAMMELGALICLPKNPKCRICPVQTFCRAFQKNAIDRYPTITKQKPVPVIRAVALIPIYQKKVFTRQRPKEGLWGGLWEFPTFEKLDEPAQAQKTLLQEHSILCRSMERRGALRHQLTHRTMNVEVFLAHAKHFASKNGQWLSIDQWQDHPYSRMQQKIGALALPV